MKSNKVSATEYWMTYDAEDLADKLESNHQLFMTDSYNPVYSMWVRNNYAYYSTILDAQSWFTALNFAGEQGELVKMSVPQARVLIRQMVTLLTKQKLAFNAIARVQNSDVTEAMRIANAIAAEVVQKQNLDIKAEHLVERGAALGTSFIKTTWRTDWGNPRVVQKREDGSSAVLYDGDLEITTPSIFDVIYNFKIDNWDFVPWADCRVKRNRWDLIEQHPNLETEILRLPGCEDYANQNSIVESPYERDMVYVYEMYHRPCPALPQGRMLFYSNSKTIYRDDVNKYGTIPIEQFKPEPIEGIGYGYAALSNLLPSQEMLDNSYSCQATNQSALGVLGVMRPSGGNINVQSLYGMNFFDYPARPDMPNGGKPEVLNLYKPSPELMKFPELLLKNMQQMSFINDAVRGELPASTSGVAIATLTTNALEFLSSYSKCLKITLEKTMMHAINAYRRFAQIERMVTMTGKNFQQFQRSFTGDVLDPINQIEMQEINPMMQSLSGRIEIASNALKEGMIKDLQGYVSILDGQPLSRLFDTELSQNDLIQSENDRMVQGEMVKAIATDNHALHIMKHNTILNDPQIRLNSPEIAQAVQQHMLEHLELQKMTDPMLMAMANTGLVPQMAPGMGEMPPPDGGQPPPGSPSAPQLIPDSDIMGQEQPLPEANPAEPADDLLDRGA